MGYGRLHLDDDETGTSAVCSGEVDARLIVGDVEALNSREGAVGKTEERSERSPHVDLMNWQHSSN